MGIKKTFATIGTCGALTFSGCGPSSINNPESSAQLEQNQLKDNLENQLNSKLNIKNISSEKLNILVDFIEEKNLDLDVFIEEINNLKANYKEVFYNLLEEEKNSYNYDDGFTENDYLKALKNFLNEYIGCEDEEIPKEDSNNIENFDLQEKINEINKKTGENFFVQGNLLYLDNISLEFENINNISILYYYSNILLEAKSFGFNEGELELYDGNENISTQKLYSIKLNGKKYTLNVEIHGINKYLINIYDEETNEIVKKSIYFEAIKTGERKGGNIDIFNNGEKTIEIIAPSDETKTKFLTGNVANYEELREMVKNHFKVNKPTLYNISTFNSLLEYWNDSGDNNNPYKKGVEEIGEYFPNEFDLILFGLNDDCDGWAYLGRMLMEQLVNIDGIKNVKLKDEIITSHAYLGFEIELENGKIITGTFGTFGFYIVTKNEDGELVKISNFNPNDNWEDFGFEKTEENLEISKELLGSTHTWASPNSLDTLIHTTSGELFFTPDSFLEKNNTISISPSKLTEIQIYLYKIFKDTKLPIEISQELLKTRGLEETNIHKTSNYNLALPNLFHIDYAKVYNSETGEKYENYELNPFRNENGNIIVNDEIINILEKNSDLDIENIRNFGLSLSDLNKIFYNSNFNNQEKTQILELIKRSAYNNIVNNLGNSLSNKSFQSLLSSTDNKEDVKYIIDNFDNFDFLSGDSLSILVGKVNGDDSLIQKIFDKVNSKNLLIDFLYSIKYSLNGLNPIIGNKIFTELIEIFDFSKIDKSNESLASIYIRFLIYNRPSEIEEYIKEITNTDFLINLHYGNPNKDLLREKIENRLKFLISNDNIEINNFTKGLQILLIFRENIINSKSEEKFFTEKVYYKINENKEELLNHIPTLEFLEAFRNDVKDYITNNYENIDNNILLDSLSILRKYNIFSIEETNKIINYLGEEFKNNNNVNLDDFWKLLQEYSFNITQEEFIKKYITENNYEQFLENDFLNEEALNKIYTFLNEDKNLLHLKEFPTLNFFNLYLTDTKDTEKVENIKRMLEESISDFDSLHNFVKLYYNLRLNSNEEKYIGLGDNNKEFSKKEKEILNETGLKIVIPKVQRQVENITDNEEKRQIFVDVIQNIDKNELTKFLLEGIEKKENIIYFMEFCEGFPEFYNILMKVINNEEFKNFLN